MGDETTCEVCGMRWNGRPHELCPRCALEAVQAQRDREREARGRAELEAERLEKERHRLAQELALDAGQREDNLRAALIGAQKAEATAVEAVYQAERHAIEEGERRAAAEGALREAREALGFFASVIKSGEPWTEVCEQRYRRALAAASPSPAGRAGPEPSPGAEQDGEGGKGEP